MEGGPGPVFIGRARELGSLDGALRGVRDGGSATLILAGEAGVGKSRLVREFAQRAAADGCRVLTGHCLELGERGLPYAPFVEAFRALVRSVEPGALPALLGPGRTELSRLLPELDTRVGLDSELDEMSRAGQARLFELFLGLLERLTRDGPLLFVIEDLHWSDGSTRDLLAFLVRLLRQPPVLFLITTRTDEMDAQHPAFAFLAELERLGHVERLDVPRFTRDEVLLQVRAGGLSPSSDDIDAITERTDGNPFFVEQLVAAHAETSDGELPTRLRDVLLARIARLSPVAQEVLRAASAAGARVDDELLGAIVELPSRQLHAALREALARQVLVPVDGESGTYEFRHALVREVVYRELFSGERRRLHAAYAGALTARATVRPEPGSVAPSAAELAFHWDAARDWERALPAAVGAGDAAERVYAFGEALRHYRRALALWDRVADPISLVRADRAWLLQRAAEAAVVAGAYRSAVDLGREALDALPVTVDLERRAWYLERMRWYLFEAGDRMTAEAMLDEADRLIPREPASGARAIILAHRAGIDMYAGRLDSARTTALEAMATARAAGTKPQEAMALGILGWSTAMLGDVDDGVGRLRQAVQLAEDFTGPEGLALGYSSLAGLLSRVGRWEECLVVAREGYERAAQQGLSWTYGGLLRAAEAGALFALGRWQEAERVTREGLAREPGGRAAIALYVERARLDTAVGRLDDAERHLAQAWVVDGQLGGTEHRLALAAAAAELACWRGDLEQCRQAVASALHARHDGPPELTLLWLAAIALRAEADAAESAGARHDDATIEAVRLAAREVVAQLEAAGFQGPATIVSPDLRDRAAAIEALCHVELARLDRAATPSSWSDIAATFDRLGQPYPAAYARYRQAVAVMSTRGSRPEAEGALQSAHEVVAGWPAGPLAREIDVLGRQARLDLAASVAPDGHDAHGPATRIEATSPFAGLGLTDREREVLHLVAGGWSNQQIADALFITRKTASVHVSNILGKLGVENRVGAAALARRLGVPAADPPSVDVSS